MVNSFTTVTHHSWGQRFSSSIKGIVGGFLCILIAISLLAWNEGNSVQAHKSLREAEKLCNEVSSIDKIDAILENALIHVSGQAVPENTPVDTLFQVYPSTPALKLQRHVEMYQWVEHTSTKETKNAGGSTDTETTYSYQKEWVDHVVDSYSSFQYPQDHENPTTMPFDSLTQVSASVNMGAFVVSDLVLNKMNWFVPLASTNYSTSFLPPQTVGDYQVSVYQDKGYYFGQSSSSPAVGDTRVSFSFIPQQVISVVGRQTANTFSNYVTSNGRQVLLVEPGVVSAAEMFVHANQQVTTMTWIIRVLGFVLLWAGFGAILKPASVFADVIPFIGNLLEAGADLISFILALNIGTVVIAISWLFFRPFVSILLLGSVGGISYHVWKRRRDQNNGVAVAHVVSQTDDLELQPNGFK